jgi:vacuolar-type H+-ATPase subunit B/Vma2
MSFGVSHSRLVAGLGSQSIELFGHTKGLTLEASHLTFLDHSHQLDASKGMLGCVKAVEGQHRTGDPFNSAMVLFHGF